VVDWIIVWVVVGRVILVCGVVVLIAAAGLEGKDRGWW
jgi:hypothetical protein